MSQVFGADSVNNTLGGSIPTSTETTAVTGNFLSPPFGNAKAIVSATIQFTVGTGTVSGAIKVRRNPSGENLQVGGLGGLPVTVGANPTISVVVADAIPDGRPVQYAVTVTQNGASANGTILYANVTTMLISG